MCRCQRFRHTIGDHRHQQHRQTTDPAADRSYLDIAESHAASGVANGSQSIPAESGDDPAWRCQVGVRIRRPSDRSLLTLVVVAATVE